MGYGGALKRASWVLWLAAVGFSAVAIGVAWSNRQGVGEQAAQCVMELLERDYKPIATYSVYHGVLRRRPRNLRPGEVLAPIDVVLDDTFTSGMPALREWAERHDREFRFHRVGGTDHRPSCTLQEVGQAFPSESPCVQRIDFSGRVSYAGLLERRINVVGHVDSLGAPWAFGVDCVFRRRIDGGWRFTLTPTFIS